MKSSILNISLKPVLMCLLLVGATQELTSQVTIGAGSIPDKSAALDIANTDKGLLIPQVKLKGNRDNDAIQDPASSLIVYNLTYGDNGTPLDTSDDVYPDNLYVFENGRWNLLYQESDLEVSLQSSYLPQIVSIVSMKKGTNDPAFVGNNLGGEVRKYLFSEKLRDDENCFNIVTGEFTAPNTGYYRIEINILLRQLSINETNKSLWLGISEPYSLSGSNISNKFHDYTNVLNPARPPEYPVYLGFKTLIHLKEGEIISPLVRYISSPQFSLNVEAMNYDRMATNTMSIIFFPLPS